MSSPQRSGSARKAKNLSAEEIENLLHDLEKYKKQEEAEKKKHEQQSRKDTQANKKKVTRELQMASKEVRKKEMEVKKLQTGLAKVEQQEDAAVQKKARQNERFDDGIQRLRKKFQDLEQQLVQKVEESGKAHGWLAHVEFAQSMLEQTGKLLETEVDPNFELEPENPPIEDIKPPPEPPPQVVQEKVQLQKRTSRLHQENERLRKEIEENRRIVQALEDSTNRFVAKRKAQAEENGSPQESPKPKPAISPSTSPKTRPVILSQPVSMSDLRSPSYPGPMPQGSYYGYGVGNAAYRISASPVALKGRNSGGFYANSPGSPYGGYGGYAAYGAGGTTFTTAVGYPVGSPGQRALSPAVGESVSYGGNGPTLARPYSMPQLALAGGSPFKVVQRESPAGMGQGVSLSPYNTVSDATAQPFSREKSKTPIRGPKAPAALETAEPGPRHGGRFQNAVRKVQAQALREYRDIIANDPVDM